MKKINLFIIAVLLFLLISCAGSAKKKGAENIEANEGVGKTNELAEKTDESPVEDQTPSEELADGGADASLDAETAQAAPDDEMPAEASLLDTEPAKAPEVAVVTPPVPPPPPAQPQPPPAQPPPAQTPPPPRQLPPAQAQTQPPRQTPPAQTQTQTPPVQPPVESPTASESDPSNSDSQPKKEPSPFADARSAPAPRIDSLLQMGTMPHDNEIVFSRIVRATVGQIVEIPFRGNGWVFLGELTSQRGIVYNSRRNDSDGQTFIFTLEEAGTYVLKFYRQDFIRDYLINDHVQVVVGEAPTAGAGWFNPPVDRGRVVAQPRWPSAIEETQIRSGVKPVSEPVVTVGATEPARPATPASPNAAPQQRPSADRETSAPQRASSAQEATAANRTPAQAGSVPPSSAAAVQPPPAQTTPVTAAAQSEAPSAEKQERLAPEVIMQKARESFDGGNIAAAIALLDQFMADYPGGSDEVYWLLGQYYEANSPSRNILLSLDYYRRLVNEYPQSRRFNDARRRIAYLERYYINIQ